MGKAKPRATKHCPNSAADEDKTGTRRSFQRLLQDAHSRPDSCARIKRERDAYRRNWEALAIERAYLVRKADGMEGREGNALRRALGRGRNQGPSKEDEGALYLYESLANSPPGRVTVCHRRPNGTIVTWDFRVRDSERARVRLDALAITAEKCGYESPGACYDGLMRAQKRRARRQLVDGSRIADVPLPTRASARRMKQTGGSIAPI